MAKDESKLVEAVEESTELAESTTENGIDDKFNPLAFTEDTELKELITEVKEEEEKTEETEESNTEEDDSWKWAKDEKGEENKEEDVYNWEEEEKED